MESKDKNLYYLYFGPRNKGDSSLAKYSGYMGFGSREELDAFTKKFSGEKELIYYYYQSRCSSVLDLCDKVEEDFAVWGRINDQNYGRYDIELKYLEKKNEKKRRTSNNYGNNQCTLKPNGKEEEYSHGLWRPRRK